MDWETNIHSHLSPKLTPKIIGDFASDTPRKWPWLWGASCRQLCRTALPTARGACSLLRISMFVSVQRYSALCSLVSSSMKVFFKKEESRFCCLVSLTLTVAHSGPLWRGRPLQALGEQVTALPLTRHRKDTEIQADRPSPARFSSTAAWPQLSILTLVTCFGCIKAKIVYMLKLFTVTLLKFATLWAPWKTGSTPGGRCDSRSGWPQSPVDIGVALSLHCCPFWT